MPWKCQRLIVGTGRYGLMERGEARGAPSKSRSADFAHGRSYRDTGQPTQGNQRHSPRDVLTRRVLSCLHRAPSSRFWCSRGNCIVSTRVSAQMFESLNERFSRASTSVTDVKVWRAHRADAAICISPDTSHVDDSGTVSGQFGHSGDFRWNRALRDGTVFLTLRESCVWALPAFAAAEAEIVATHLGERTNFSRARVSATYMM
jgi:hypothetical protein